MTSESGGAPVRWRTAAEQALYGPDGFYTREAPGSHFRTSVHASALFAQAVARLLLRVDTALGHPAPLDLVDVGGGRGELAHGVLEALSGTEAERRVRVRVIERGPRPERADPRVGWEDELPGPGSVAGLVFANEWLDNVPLDIAGTDGAGVPRYVLTDRAGRERLGPPLEAEDAAWLARWWPLAGAGPGARAEVGRPRDEAWTAAVRALGGGLAVAADYAHSRDARPPFGTLTGFREGREVPAVPDGRGDLTAHVALDACADACGPLCAQVRMRTQREVLRDLEVTGTRPPLALAHTDPAEYVRRLGAAGEAAELLDPGGLGAFGWLLCGVGMPVPLD
ncbi:SAM-dependent methyltransferase [Streptomyces boncukensis]|uniref:SAM-dependent methyltransferase n=1 Tax=Streptomyces boncukensis TaxID=2711219 RepID=A0A6G4WXU8_9ACTN|nr:SAM-dependent methyltransferase [Streptomyces boncukensis]NGO70119.1 hypothetical protein [Streptomyces boncukensis]